MNQTKQTTLTHPSPNAATGANILKRTIQHMSAGPFDTAREQAMDILNTAIEQCFAVEILQPKPAAKRRRIPPTNIGSVSSGTMRTEDLIPDFIYELRRQVPLTREHRKLIRGIELDIRNHTPHGKDASHSAYWDLDQAGEDLGELMDALDTYAPPYFYFGAHPGDGADYGFWLSESFREDFDGLIVDDSWRGRQDEIPKGYTGEVLRISDHGNMTLLAYSRGRSREVWGIV
jgi:hypothetical protein